MASVLYCKTFRPPLLAQDAVGCTETGAVQELSALDQVGATELSICFLRRLDTSEVPTAKNREEEITR